jgi:hypothetical protein
MSISWREGLPLPNADQAEIDLRKFTDYSLKPDNPQNQGKWMGFAMIGYPIETPTGRQIATQDIIQQIRQNLPDTPAYKSKNNPYGIRLKVTIKIKGFNGQKGNLITIWQIDQDKTIPRLITNWLEVYS